MNDVGLWLAIASLALAIPLGIATNLLTPRVVAYLEQRKILKSHRTKAQELAAYRRIKAFQNGSRDKYAHYIVLAISSITCSCVSMTCFILVALRYGYVLNTPFNVFWLIAMGFVFASLFFGSEIAETARRLERFQEYEQEIRAKWGAGSI